MQLGHVDVVALRLQVGPDEPNGGKSCGTATLGHRRLDVVERVGMGTDWPGAQSEGGDESAGGILVG